MLFSSSNKGTTCCSQAYDNELPVLSCIKQGEKNLLLCSTVPSPPSPRPLLSRLFTIWLPSRRPFSSLCIVPRGRQTTLKNVLPAVVTSHPTLLRCYSQTLRYAGTSIRLRAKFTPLSIAISCFMVYKMCTFFRTSFHCKTDSRHSGSSNNL